MSSQMTINDYKTINHGLLNPDSSMRDTFVKLGAKSKYRNNLATAQTRFVDASLGLKPNIHNHEAIGVIDKTKNTLNIDYNNKKKQFSLLSLNKHAKKMIDNVKADRFAVSKIAIQCLSDIGAPTNNKRLSAGNKQLQDAFYNEVLLQTNMEKYLKRSGASHIYKTNKDQLRHLVDKNGFEQSFNDGLKKLSKEAQAPKKHKQMGR